MTLEISLKPLFSLPQVLWSHSDEPRRDIHWVGQRNETGEQKGADKQDKPPKKPNNNAPGYRSLSSIKLSDVDDAQKHFASQLIPVHYPAWIGTNYFCNLTLTRKRDGRPPMIFGRVKSCFPTDGYFSNIQEIELHFPHKEGKPDPVLLTAQDIIPPPQGVIQSYAIRVKFFASQEDESDFSSFENLFPEQGLAVEYSGDYIELLHLDDFKRDSYPWLWVISSRWFESIPLSVKDEIRKSLKDLIGWGKSVFNYHPKWLPPEIHNLNRELDLNYGFTEHYLIAPESPQQTAHIVAVSLNKIFAQPIQ